MADTYRISNILLATGHILLAVLVQQILDEYNEDRDCNC
jgi:hypothetical protein